MQGYEFVEHYRLEYQREANGAWFRYRNRRGEEVRYYRAAARSLCDS